MNRRRLNDAPILILYGIQPVLDIHVFLFSISGNPSLNAINDYWSAGFLQHCDSFPQEPECIPFSRIGFHHFNYSRKVSESQQNNTTFLYNYYKPLCFLMEPFTR